jgi:hypothetical protein
MGISTADTASVLSVTAPPRAFERRRVVPLVRKRLRVLACCVVAVSISTLRVPLHRIKCYALNSINGSAVSIPKLCFGI